MKEKYPGWVIRVNDADTCWNATADNGLFDEVYEGPLFISDKLILSHEPIDLPYAVNIHGHEHRYVFRDHHLNVCAEHIDYYPQNVNRMIKDGLLSKVESIHRMTIDRATVRKKNIAEKGVVLSTVAYICDQERCENCSAETGFCYHTTDIHHAVNFEEVEPGKFMEKE
jgi:hypothetical protein